MITKFNTYLIDKGYYPDMTVGKANNLVGRGDVQDAQINFRPSGGVLGVGNGMNITDGAARIERIKGNSVVYNQLRFDNITSNTYTFQVSQSGNRIEFSNAYADYVKITVGDTAVLNHYYYIACDVIENDFGLATITHNAGAMAVNALKLSNNGRNEIIVQCKTLHATDNSWKFMIHDAEFSGKHTIVDNLVIIDLTKEFDEAIANEIATASDPVAKYNELKPMNIEDEFAYNAGTLVDMKATTLISTSDNAYNPDKEKARVLGGKKYDITTSTGVSPRVEFENDKGEIGAEFEKVEGKYVFSTDGYLTFANTDELGDICVCLSYSYPKPHPPYQQEVKDLSFIGEAFPEGMRSAGSAFDEIRYNRTTKKWEAVKRIGELKLADIPKSKWTTVKFNGYDAFRVTKLDINVGTELNNNSNVLMNIYVKGDLEIHQSGLNKAFELNHGYYGSAATTPFFVIRDTDYADIDSLVASFEQNNATLYYELATPIVEEIDLSPNFNLDYFAWDFGTEEAIASITSAPFRADIQYGDNFVDDIRKNKEDIATNKANIAKNVSAINSKQNTLTLTIKSNGNIVIGNIAGQTKEFMPATPSGDPMHYAYEAAGAIWNATTGYWETTRLKNITNAEMRHIYNLGNIPSYVVSPFNSVHSYYRTNLPRLGSSNTLNWDFYSFASNNAVIEVIDLTISKSFEGTILVSRGLEAFKGCSNLREIYGLLKIAEHTTDMFAGCASLSRVKIKELKLSISFADSPLLSKESLLYMIDNCALNATFTITLHPDVYAKCVQGAEADGEWFDDIETALSDASLRSSVITLASA